MLCCGFFAAFFFVLACCIGYKNLILAVASPLALLNFSILFQQLERERLTARPESKASLKRKKALEKTEEEKATDERKCLLCGAAGDRDSQLAGRLLFYR